MIYNEISVVLSCGGHCAKSLHA